MPETITPIGALIPVRVTYACDQCGADTKSLGAGCLSVPPLYSHECTACGHRINLPDVYPMVRWVSPATLSERQ